MQDPDNVEYYEFMAKDNVPFHSVVFPATLLGTEDENLKWTKVTNLMSTGLVTISNIFSSG